MASSSMSGRMCLVSILVLIFITVCLFQWIFAETSRIITFFVIVGLITAAIVGTYIHRSNKKRTLRALLLDAKDEEIRKQMEFNLPNTAGNTLEEPCLDNYNLQGGQEGIESIPRDTPTALNPYGNCSKCGKPRMSQAEIFCSNCGNRY